MHVEHDRLPDEQPGSYVLVVDDELPIREVLTEILEEDFKVVTVANGAQALSYLKNHPPPSCILLDYNMPVMNAEQFRKVQLSLPTLKDVPVILMTAGKDIQLKADQLQAKTYLHKPFNIDRLIEVVSVFW